MMDTDQLFGVCFSGAWLLLLYGAWRITLVRGGRSQSFRTKLWVFIVSHVCSAGLIATTAFVTIGLGHAPFLLLRDTFPDRSVGKACITVVVFYLTLAGVFGMAIMVLLLEQERKRKEKVGGKR